MYMLVDSFYVLDGTAEVISTWVDYEKPNARVSNKVAPTPAPDMPQYPPITPLLITNHQSWLVSFTR
jgi:hypothetical protein